MLPFRREGTGEYRNFYATARNGLMEQDQGAGLFDWGGADRRGDAGKTGSRRTRTAHGIITSVGPLQEDLQINCLRLAYVLLHRSSRRARSHSVDEVSYG